MTRIAIIGGGITGLAAAYELERICDAEIDLYEAADQLGGKLLTRRQDEYLIEEGPDCFFARKAGVREFVAELGLADQLIEPRAREFSILVEGRLHRMPRGLTNLQRPSPEAVCEATFLCEEAKRRVLAPELVDVGDDISIRSFFSQRFGAEFSRLVAEPLLAGTHGGDPDRLSMRALYPGYLEAAEAAPTTDGPTFLSFRDGMQTLVDGLKNSLRRTRIHLGHRLEALPSADATLVALPAPAAARLLPAEVADLLAAIPHRDAWVTTAAYSSAAFQELPTGTGFLVPAGEHPYLTGATWSSLKWARRAPENSLLVRWFSRSDPGTLDCGHLRLLSGAKDLPSEPASAQAPNPLFNLPYHLPAALPQYELGHLDRLGAIDEAMLRLPGVFLAGTSYRGVGIPDSLRQGRVAARKTAKVL